jgi:exopolysaccharide biosynthesis predicted pyruvyltransferase EpsI
LAPNHEDQKVLKRIKTLNSEVHYIHPNNLYDIMYLISNSNCYIGTSLHGMITAQSFNIPFMPLNKKVVKMDNYCKTWTNEVCEGCIDYNKIEDIIDKYLNWNYSKLVKITNHQKALVYKNFECIFEKLI